MSVAVISWLIPILAAWLIGSALISRYASVPVSDPLCRVPALGVYWLTLGPLIALACGAVRLAARVARA